MVCVKECRPLCERKPACPPVKECEPCRRPCCPVRPPCCCPCEERHEHRHSCCCEEQSRGHSENSNSYDEENGRGGSNNSAPEFAVWQPNNGVNIGGENIETGY